MEEKRKKTGHTKESPAPVSPPPPAPPTPPHPPAEEAVGFPTQFARLFFGAITLLVLYYAYEIVKPFLIEIFLALVLFFTVKPLFLALTRLLRGRRALASALTCLVLALVILIPLLTLVSIIANQALELSRQISRGLQDGHLWQWCSAQIDHFKGYLVHLNLPLPPENIKLEQIIQTVLAKASEFIYNNAVSLLKGFTSYLFSLILVLFLAFFMFLQGDDFIAEVKKLSPLDTAHNEEIFREMEKTIKSTLWSTVVVAFIQGAVGGVGLFLFGVPQAAFWGVVMVPSALMPLVGAAIIWFPAALYLFFVGSLAKAIGLALWCAVIIGSIDNLLKPMLMRGARHVPTIFLLFSILGGITYFGMVGFILGPLILSFLLSLLRIYQTTILRPAHAKSHSKDKKTPL